MFSSYSKRKTSPRRKKATSPRRKKATSPRRKKATSPRRKKATSPRRKKTNKRKLNPPKYVPPVTVNKPAVTPFYTLALPPESGLDSMYDICLKLVRKWTERRGMFSFGHSNRDILPFDYYLYCRNRGETDMILRSHSFDADTHIHLKYFPESDHISAIPKTQLIKNSRQQKIMRPEITITFGDIQTIQTEIGLGIEEIISSTVDLLESLLNCSGDTIKDSLQDRGGTSHGNKEISLVSAFSSLDYKTTAHEANFRLAGGRGRSSRMLYPTREELEAGLILAEENARVTRPKDLLSG